MGSDARDLYIASKGALALGRNELFHQRDADCCNSRQRLLVQIRILLSPQLVKQEIMSRDETDVSARRTISTAASDFCAALALCQS